MRGTHFIKAWCKTQQCVTLSSAEAELVAMNKGASELLGALSMFADLGEHVSRGRGNEHPATHVVAGSVEPMTGVVCGDSSAAIAISQRKGCGKLRRVRGGQLWA